MNTNINKEKLMWYLENKNKLPVIAFTLLPSDHRQVILVKNGETGYYPYKVYDTEEQAYGTVVYGNDSIGVSAEAAEALKILSMRTII